MLGVAVAGTNRSARRAPAAGCGEAVREPILLSAAGRRGTVTPPTASLATRYKVPTVWFNAIFPRAGGLFSYAADINDQWYRTAAYIDHILRGAKPADLPVQQPVKFEMVVNAKAAKALGLTVPQSILLRADEVIE
jgi:ABC transporter substrate binding protein